MRRKTKKIPALASLVWLLIVVLSPVQAQRSIADSSISFFTITPYYQFNQSAGNLADRFGYHHALGGQAGFKHKSNFYFTLGFHTIFSDQVRETNVIDQVGYFTTWSGGGQTTGKGGWVEGNFGDVTFPAFYMRGFAVPLRIGYIFNYFRWGKMNPNCGLFVETGLQFLQHKIKIEIPVSADMPYLDKEMLKGYDRLTNGIGPLLSLGYQFYGNKRFVNFYIGVDAAWNVTQSRRSWNYDTGLQDNRTRSDIQYGARIGWTLPLYPTAPDRYYYY